MVLYSSWVFGSIRFVGGDSDERASLHLFRPFQGLNQSAKLIPGLNLNALPSHAPSLDCSVLQAWAWALWALWAWTGSANWLGAQLRNERPRPASTAAGFATSYFKVVLSNAALVKIKDSNFCKTLTLTGKG